MKKTSLMLVCLIIIATQMFMLSSCKKEEHVEEHVGKYYEVYFGEYGIDDPQGELSTYAYLELKSNGKIQSVIIQDTHRGYPRIVKSGNYSLNNDSLTFEIEDDFIFMTEINATIKNGVIQIENETGMKQYRKKDAEWEPPNNPLDIPDGIYIIESSSSERYISRITFKDGRYRCTLNGNGLSSSSPFMYFGKQNEKVYIDGHVIGVGNAQIEYDLDTGVITLIYEFEGSIRNLKFIFERGLNNVE